MTCIINRILPTIFKLLLAVAIVAVPPDDALAGAGDAASTYGLGPINAGSALTRCQRRVRS